MIILKNVNKYYETFITSIGFFLDKLKSGDAIATIGVKYARRIIPAIPNKVLWRISKSTITYLANDESTTLRRIVEPKIPTTIAIVLIINTWNK